MTTVMISADSTMREVLAECPGGQRALMRRYHVGGCSSCGFSPQERLGDVLARHSILNVDEVIAHLRSNEEQEACIQIAANELAALLEGDAPPRLLDVRGPEEREIVQLEGAIPVTQELVQEMLATWPKNTAIVTYCHHGLRSLEAASYLIGHGFTKVRSLTGGIDAWAEQIDPALPRY